MRVALLVAVSMLGLAVGVRAETVPTTEEVIAALKPRLGDATRGIRPVGPATPGRAAAPAVAASPQTAPGIASFAAPVLFVSGSDQLTPQAMRTLDSIGRALASADLREFRFRIEGHTDTAGTRSGNESLSARRAATVVDYIAIHHGIDRARMVPVGLGQSQPQVPTADGVSEPRNRRVQIVNLGT